MKKLAIIGILGLVLGIGGLFADHPDGLGIGIEFNGGTGGFGPALSLKIPSLPIFWSVGLSFGGDYFGLGLTGDYYFIDKALVPDINLGWYVGVGGFAYLGFNDDDMWFGLGARVPIGLSWQFLEKFELFVEIAPQLGLEILPDPKFPYGNFFTGALGARIWL
jgi:hypothetical protein